MKDKKLLFDRKCHVLYSRPCKKEIRAKIALHYPEAERETIWEQVQRQYADFLSDWRTDLGGKRNFHNGVGGTYDCIAIMSYYTVCKAVTSFRYHARPVQCGLCVHGAAPRKAGADDYLRGWLPVRLCHLRR